MVFQPAHRRFPFCGGNIIDIGKGMKPFSSVDSTSNPPPPPPPPPTPYSPPLDFQPLVLTCSRWRFRKSERGLLCRTWWLFSKNTDKKDGKVLCSHRKFHEDNLGKMIFKIFIWSDKLCWFLCYLDESIKYCLIYSKVLNRLRKWFG